MKQSVWIFCLGSGLGFASGFGPLIKTGNSGGQVINKEEVGRMHKYGTGNTGVCLGYNEKDKDIARKANSKGDLIKLVFWFQEGNQGNCDGLLEETDTQKISQKMKENGYWKVTLKKEEIDQSKIKSELESLIGSAKLAKLGSQIETKIKSCIESSAEVQVERQESSLCQAIQKLVVKDIGNKGGGTWIWMK